MKNKFINKIIIILIILGVMCGLNNECFAENTTNENSTTQTSSKNESTKSSNANLSNLGIRPNDFTGFRYGTTTYNVTVPESTKSVEVYAQAQDSKAKVSGTGTKTLENDKTSVDVVVTAEDGTKKTYTINITKSDTTNNAASSTSKESQSSNEVKSNGLSSLKINELNLTPDFKTDIYEYNVKYIGEETKLEIKAEPTNDNYEVEILENKDLKEGENIITILVSDKNAENIATYQITVNKSLVDEDISNKEEMQKNLIIVGIIGAILVVIIIVFRMKRKNDKEYEEEFAKNTFSEFEEDVDEFENENEKNYNDEEELPRAFRKKSTNKYEYEEITKESARKDFLDGYNSTDYDYKEERTKTKHKGKRFK